MKERDELFRELKQRQQNVLPTDTLRNGTFFDAALARGNVSFNPAQRFGACLLGFFYLFVGSVAIARAIGAGVAIVAIFTALIIWIGIKTIINGVTAPSAPKHKHFANTE